MPFILIIAGIIAAIGFAGFMFTQNPTGDKISTVTPVARAKESTSTNSIAETSTTLTLNTNNIPSTGATNPTPVSAATTLATAYKNGVYNVTTTYIAPGRSSHSVSARLIIENDIVTLADIDFGGDIVKTSTDWQAKFVAKYQSEVIGEKVDAISLSRIGGASLTTNAYNKALEEVKAAAKS